jgi:hypothetical protein
MKGGSIAMANLSALPAEEARRTKQVGIKLSELEHAKIGQAAAASEMELAAWCRQTLLEAAGGERATTHVEVPIGDVKVLEERIERVGAIVLATLGTLFEHCHHGDPNKKGEDEVVAARARERAAAKMEKFLQALNPNGGRA